MTDSEKNEVIELSERLLDGRINPADLARLEEWFANSPEAIDLYLEASHDEVTLPELLTEMEGREVEPFRPRWNWRKTLIVSTAAAAVILILVVARGWLGDSGEQAPVLVADPASNPAGVISGGLGVRWADGVRPLKIGASLGGEQISFEGGALEVRCSNGVLLLVEGPASFCLEDSMNLNLEYGSLVAEVSEAQRSDAHRRATRWIDAEQQSHSE